MVNSFSPMVEINSYIDSIRHRGPDGHGTYVSNDGSCQMGHVRLSIQDLSEAGSQPMDDITGRYCIVFNGEIYNQFELRKLLESKYPNIRWRSQSDTEVIVEGFAHEGERFLSKLNGIFAFGIYDRLDNVLSVLRDPFGVKPLFLTNQAGGYYFCSEMKGLKKMPFLKKTLRLQSLADQLSFMYIPEPHTRYDEFYKIEPGVLHRYKKGKQISSDNFFEKPSPIVSPISIQDATTGFASHFSNAVKRQLVSDVPVGIMLSGGLDSSAVCFEAMRQGCSITEAFTVSFKNELYDRQGNDYAFAKILANKLGLSINTIEVSEDIFDMLPKIQEYLEDGVSDPAALLTYLISKKAKESGISVLMTGHGADEILCGYRRYSAELVFSKMPNSFLNMIASIEKYIPDLVPGRLNSIFRRAKRFANYSSMTGVERIKNYYMQVEEDRVKLLFKDPQKVNPGIDLLGMINGQSISSPIKLMMDIDAHYDLLSLNLTYTDRMSMAMGVEARVPFLDLKLTDYIRSLPIEYLTYNNQRKYLLKKSMEGKIPKEIIYRNKAGFGMPIKSWLRKNSNLVNFYLNKSLIDGRGIFNSTQVELIKNNHLSGKIDNASLIFSLLCIQIWLENEGEIAQ